MKEIEKKAIEEMSNDLAQHCRTQKEIQSQRLPKVQILCRV